MLVNFDFPVVLWEEIESTYSTDTERILACVEKAT